MSDHLFSEAAAVSCENWSWRCSYNGLAEHTIIRAAATLLAAALAIACCARWVKKLNKNMPPLPPGPPGLPILGNLPFLEPDLLQYFSKLSQIYGPVIKLRLGFKVCVVINSASAAKEALKDHDAIFSNRDTPAAVIVGVYGGSDIAWRPNAPEFRKVRKLAAQEIVSSKNLDDCYALRQREVRKMVKDIYGKVGSSPVNIGDQMFLTGLNVITSMLWGDALHGEERNYRLGIEFRQGLGEFIELLGAPNISDLFPFLTRFDLQGVQSRMKKASAWFDEILESAIAQRAKVEHPEGEAKDFLRLLLKLNQEGDYKSSLSKDEIKAMLMDIITGGTDTTSTTLEWAMTELLRNPDIMRKAVEELDKVVGDRSIVEESHLPQLVYIDAVIKEALRLHPPTPMLLPRRPSMDCTVAGYTIPKDSRVLINAWAIQRDPEFWEDPLKFEPERFLKHAERGSYQGNNFHFLPFGSGRRICIGISMAERMMRLILAALLHSFDWKLPEGAEPDVREKLGITLKKIEPLVAIPVARLSNSELYQ